MPAPPKSAASSSKKSKNLKKTPNSSAAVVPAAPPLDPAAVNQVFDWIVAGHSEHGIQEAIAQQFPGTAPRALVNEALERLLQTVKVPEEVVVAFGIEGSRACYQKLFELGDFVGALRAIKQMADLAARLPKPETDDEEDSQGGE